MQTYAYFKNNFVPLTDVKLGVMTHTIHYGTAIFEGIRGNWNEKRQQMYLFRLREHYIRMLDGCKALKIDLPYRAEELCDITIEICRRSNFKENVYIRPLAYKSSEVLGCRLHGLDADFLVFAIPWGDYISTTGVKCKISSWQRPANTFMPSGVKCCGYYVNNALAKTEAIDCGFDEAIMLNPDGYISEGSAENIFLVIDHKLVTPATYNNIIVGITRRTVIELAKRELGIETIERPINRNELYEASECFLTGTAANICSVTNVDNRQIGDGKVGNITEKLQTLYMQTAIGEKIGYDSWCTPVYSTIPV